jgi:hypothetical protein
MAIHICVSLLVSSVVARSGIIEDEVHFLIKCSENKVAREQLFLQIYQKCKNFTSLSNEVCIYENMISNGNTYMC